MFGQAWLLTLISLAIAVQAAPIPQLNSVTTLGVAALGVAGSLAGGGGEPEDRRRQLGLSVVPKTGPIKGGIGKGNQLGKLLGGGLGGKSHEARSWDEGGVTGVMDPVIWKRQFLNPVSGAAGDSTVDNQLEGNIGGTIAFQPDTTVKSDDISKLLASTGSS